MMQLIKSYHVFLPRTEAKLLLYLVYPLLLFGMSYKLADWGVPVFIYELVCCSIIFLLELIFDSVVFGGIAAKDTNKLEYLKTSIKGMSVLRSGIIADAIRRGISAAVILFAVYVIDTTGVTIIQIITCIFVTLCCIELGLCVTRSFSMMVVILIISSILGSIAVWINVVIFMGSVAIWGSCLAIALYVLAVIGGRVIIMRNARGSYYDSRD